MLIFCFHGSLLNRHTPMRTFDMSNVTNHASFVAYVRALTANEAKADKLFTDHVEAIKAAGKALYACYEANAKGSKARAEMKETLGISGWEAARVSNLVTIGKVADNADYAECIKSSIQLSARRIKAKEKQLANADAEVTYADALAAAEAADALAADALAADAEDAPVTLQDIVNEAIAIAQYHGFSAAELLGVLTDTVAAEMPKPRRTRKAA